MGNLLFPCCKMCIIHFYPRKKESIFKIYQLCVKTIANGMLNLATKLPSKNPETLSVNVKKNLRINILGGF